MRTSSRVWTSSFAPIIQTNTEVVLSLSLPGHQSNPVQVWWVTPGALCLLIHSCILCIQPNVLLIPLSQIPTHSNFAVKFCGSSWERLSWAHENQLLSEAQSVS
jgi:hypothetical protein